MSSLFSTLSISDSLKKVMAELGFESPTAIQEQSLEPLLLGKDLIGQSKTGSGKTIAFTLPILQTLDLNNKQVQALVMCPTRELCSQVAREIRKVGRYHVGLQVLVVAGGSPGRLQAEALAKGVHIIVGTPGRLLDHIRRQQLQTESILKLVLDEADRMLDMGFEEDMELILAALPAKRQNIFFSATFPASIERMSKRYQRNPVMVKIVSDDPDENTTKHVTIPVSAAEKGQALLRILLAYKPKSAIVFCNLKVNVSDIVRSLTQVGINCEGLSGDLEQYDRDRVMAKFRNGSVQILVATDVAARGLDVEELGAVINFDVPFKSQEYVHRTGRTGRAGKSGIAISLVLPGERAIFKSIENDTDLSFENKALSEFANVDLSTLAKEIAPPQPMQTLYIAGGRKQKVRPGDILGAITGEACGLAASNVGKIEVHDHFTYVGVSRHLAKEIAAQLQKGQIKGRRFSVELLDD